MWNDRRTGASDVYGARVSAAGALVDPTGFPIWIGAGDQKNPGVAFNGTNYLVAWSSAPALGNGQLVAARVSPAGVVLDPSGIVVNANTRSDVEPSLTSNGSDFFVTWRHGSPEVAGARVPEKGRAFALAVRQRGVQHLFHLPPSFRCHGSSFLEPSTQPRCGIVRSTADRLTADAMLRYPGPAFSVPQGVGGALSRQRLPVTLTPSYTNPSGVTGLPKLVLMPGWS